MFVVFQEGHLACKTPEFSKDLPWETVVTGLTYGGELSQFVFILSFFLYWNQTTDIYREIMEIITLHYLLHCWILTKTLYCFITD